VRKRTLSGVHGGSKLRPAAVLSDKITTLLSDPSAKGDGRRCDWAGPRLALPNCCTCSKGKCPVTDLKNHIAKSYPWGWATSGRSRRPVNTSRCARRPRCGLLLCVGKLLDLLARSGTSRQKDLSLVCAGGEKDCARESGHRSHKRPNQNGHTEEDFARATRAK